MGNGIRSFPLPLPWLLFLFLVLRPGANVGYLNLQYCVWWSIMLAAAWHPGELFLGVGDVASDRTAAFFSAFLDAVKRHSSLW